MARVEQITDKAQVPAEYHALYDRIVADKVDGVAAALREESQLTSREFVLAALAVARAKDCLFVWSVQAPAARRAGVSAAAIEAIANRATSGLSADEADLV